MKTEADYRIENIEIVTVNGRMRKLFTAFERQGDAFVCIGKFSVPHTVADGNLWIEVDATNLQDED